MAQKNIFSIIIPVYKVEQYLEKCVNSLLCQDFKNFEIILVDDGSPDKCPAICDQLSQKDERVKVIHKTNGGSSSARNAGINYSSGDYLIFVDSDDYWEGTGVLDQLHRKLLSNPNTEVLLYGCKDFDVRTAELSVSRAGYDETFIEQSDKEKVVEYLFRNNLFPGSAWIVMIKSSFLRQFNLYFEVGIKAEDVDWLINVFSHAEYFAALDTSFYVYLKNRADSITGTSGVVSIHSILFTIDKWYDKLIEKKTVSSLWFLNFLAFHYLTAVLIYSNLKKEDKKMMLIDLRKHIYILKYAKLPKVKLGASIVRILGISLASIFFKKIKRI